ncbi:MAG: endo alpha-1,4 polygalactosaminidase [Deltaproteobacteria bacterium]|nr:endo alpha-1,4 polygalactosaminidase [Deltaproteobacteria bacterium]
MKWIALLFAALAALFVFWFFFRSRPVRWIVYYGEAVSARTFMDIDLAILEPDAISPNSFKDLKTLFFGYLSVGEANTSRDYWPEIMGENFIVEENPDWPGAWRVDIRSPKWRQLLLEKVIPEILAKGYQGLFLDTVDTAAYLEEKYPKKFAGSREAMVAFVQSIRARFPDALILPNNALELLDDYGEVIYGVTVEDLYTHCRFLNRTCTQTPMEETKQREEILDRFQGRFKKPVFNILYHYGDEKNLVDYAIRRSRQKGYHWYLTTPDLNALGTMGK